MRHSFGHWRFVIRASSYAFPFLLAVFQGLTLTCAQSPNTPLYGPSGELRPEQQYFRLWQNLLEPVQILDIQFSPVLILTLDQFLVKQLAKRLTS